MQVNKSVRYTFLGIIATGQLLVPVSNVVYASENTINIYVDSEKENSKNLVDSEKVLNFLFSKDIDKEYIGNFIDTNIEKISQVKDSLGLKEEVLLSLGAYYVVKNHDKFSSVDSETVPSILEGLKIVELEDLFNEEQSIEEQSKILQEHYQIEGLYDAIIELSYLYKELKIEEPVDVAAEGEEVDEVDETGETAETVEVEESKETEEETENTSDLPEAEEKEEPQSESTEEEIESIPEQPEADKDTEEEQTPTEPAEIEEEIVAEENVVKAQKSMAPAMFSTMSILTPNVQATKLHEVKAGDTLWSISMQYGVTVKNLQDWNSLTTNFLRVGQTLGVNGKYNDAQVLFSTRQQFINAILPAAKQVAAEYNLYTSVLLAQAIHESNGGNSPLAKISNNIFGIKAMTSKYVEKPTWEQNKDGSVVQILAKFEAYDTYFDAIVSYAQKIRNGVSWNPTFYKDAWPENTSSYKDATKALTGTYATDLSYNTKLNNTIQTYNLTQYDTHFQGADSLNTVVSTRDTDYSAKVTGSGHSIDTLPWGVPGYKTIGRSNQYLGQTVRVIQEKVTGRATWAYLAGIGWIDKKGITPEIITSTKDVHYMARTTRNWDSITTLPWGVEGFKTVAKSADYLDQVVEVTKEAVTPRATWALISINGKELGWIDTKGLRHDINAILTTTNTDYSAKITAGHHSIDTLPWGVLGYKTVGRSKQYLGQTYRVTQEKVNGRATWAYLEGLGWIDKSGITPESITSSKDTYYVAKVTRTWDSITTLPWGVPGYQTVAKSSEYIGKTVAVSKEAVTPRATWAYISIDGKDLGWIDVRGLEKDVNAIVSTKYTDYSAKITGANHSIDTLPWGVPGYQNVGRSRQYIGQTFRVTEERVNGRATWAYLQGLGWIDKAGITPETITSTQNVRYEAKIARTWDSITTLPWGVEGFLTVGKSANYLGQTVEVSKEAVTPRATWAYITLNGQELGWIDKSGLEVQEERRVIFIDVGHGGTDPGAVYFGVNEKDINLTVSLKLQRELEKRGYVVIMSRTDDTAIDYKTERSKIANKTDSDVFISVHHNANPYVATANGIETFYYEYDPKHPSQINGEFHNDPYRIAESGKLAGSIHNSLIASTGLYDRGVKRDTFAVLRETRIPAVLLELGFMSNESELDKLVNDIHQNKSVIGIADGIDAYFRN